MLITDKNAKIFDLTAIHKGDCIRVKYKGDPNYRNGFVTLVNEDKLQVLYCSPVGNATSYLIITAEEASVGLWEIYWTTDFITYNQVGREQAETGNFTETESAEKGYSSEDGQEHNEDCREQPEEGRLYA